VTDSRARRRPDEPALTAWRTLLATHAELVSALERELVQRHDLPLAFYDVLVQLHEAGGRLRMAELARRVVLSRGGLTRVIDRMATRGLVAREQCAEDRRGFHAVLTPAGRGALRRAWPTHADGIHRHFAAALHPGDADALTAILERVRLNTTCTGSGAAVPL
jgi:DNA-binding MarR family transcriptional regulator